MADAILLPKLGQTVEEATIVKWHKKEGDAVSKGDVLFELETDKAVLEAESFYSGTLLKVLIGEDQTAPVQSVVAYVGEAGEAIPDAPPKPATPEPASPAAQPPAAAAGPVAAPATAPDMPTVAAQPAAPAAPAAPQRLIISPRAKKLCRDKCIAPTSIRGTGPNGRITEKDVVAYLDANNYAAIKITAAAREIATAEEIDILTVTGTGTSGRITVEDIRNAVAEKPKKMSKMRQVIAARLTQSFTSTPHFYVSVSADMTDLLAYRQELKQQGKELGVNAFILEAVILSLKEFPVLNSSTDGQTTRWRSHVDLGMAVGLEEGLVVPVIRSAEDLTLKELHEVSKELAVKARGGTLLPDEMTGGSFTVSNMGMCNVENFGAIINPGESGILAVASTVPRVVVIDGEMQIRSMMTMTASVDHRIVDGTTGALFVNAVKSKLEDMDLWKRLA